MGFLNINLDKTVEDVVTGMNDETIVKIVRKLSSALLKQVHDHARKLGIAAMTVIPLVIATKGLRKLGARWQLEWEWAQKRNLSLVSAQLWVPLTREEMADRSGRVENFRVTGTPSPHRSASRDMFCSEGSDNRKQHAIKRVGFIETDSPELEDGVCSKSYPFDDHPGSHPDDAPVSTMISGVAKRCLFQQDIWNIGILRDKLMHRRVITAAEKTTPEDPFVTSFLDDSDTWYVMNAMTNELSAMCAQSHFGAMLRGELYSEHDAYVVALLVPRMSSDIQREFFGEEFSESCTAMTKIRAVVLREKTLVQLSHQRVFLDPAAPERFQRRWRILELIGDKYRRFEACRILRAAIKRAGEMASEQPYPKDSDSADGEASQDDSTRAQSVRRPISPTAERREHLQDSWQDGTGSIGALSSTISRHMQRAHTAVFSRLSSPSNEMEREAWQRAAEERVKTISEEQFHTAGRESGFSDWECAQLFRCLDIDGDGNLSVHEVEGFSKRKRKQNFISMHLQRVFLPQPACQELPGN
jgi:hypothetical protein